ncbi:MAG: polymorphic toxin-type HINT domain-containing protein [Micromonosporaceae bacterium]
MDFTVAERCIPSGTITCAESQLTAANARYWPDVPYDQICTSTTSCPGQLSPAFFSRKRLTTVTTSVWDGTKYAPADEWRLGQSFPATGDGTSAGLWLKTIQHVGKVGGDLALPYVEFTGVQLENRVDGLDVAPPLIKWRVAGVTNESGGRISVNYSNKECVAGSNIPAAPHTNTMRCFPVYWTAEGQTQPVIHYFHKYVVTSVVEDDASFTDLDKVTSYSYMGSPAWAYDDNELVLPKYRTWGGWRGYNTVETRVGAAGEQTRTRNLYLRGMDGDYLPGGGARNVTVTDSQGGVVDDNPRANGFLRETITYDGASGPEVTGTVSTPWVSGPTATSGSKTARYLGTGKTRTRVALASGSHRYTESATTFDGYGMPTQIDDLGDVSTPGDDLCTRHTYVRNTGAWALANVSRTEAVSVACGITPTRPGDVVSDQRMYYDGATSLTTPPTRGLLTQAETLGSWGDTGPSYVVTTKATYDAHGRTATATDALGRVTTTAYTPQTGGPVTAITTTNPAGHASTKTLNRAWGNATVEEDVNGRRTDLTFDPVGRLTAVWLPGRSKSGGATPHVKFSYSMSRTAPDVVTTEELRNNGTYTASYVFYDGWQRPRQTQRPAPGPAGGRVITDTEFDSHGWLLDETGPYYSTGAPSATRFMLASDTESPAQVRTSYDGAGRPTVKAFRVLGAERWRTTVAYGGDRVTTTPPAGSTPSTTIADARGRTIALRQYQGAAPTGGYDETRYSYTPDGKLSTVTDPAGNTWRHTYNLRGLPVRVDDPDKGTTTSAYDAAGQLVSTTDARRVTLHHSYDSLGRRTALREGSATGTLRASWLYDTLVKGYPTSHTRYVGSDAYTVAVKGYDAAYRPTGSAITIPMSEGALAGTYSTSMTYNVDGGLSTMALPAAPGLPSETLMHSYDGLGLPWKVSGHGAYVSGTTYSPYGEALQLTTGQYYGKAIWQTFEYETGTRRLQRIKLDREGFAATDYDARYTRDPAGNLTKIAEVGAGQPAETQCFRYDYLRRLNSAWTPGNGDCAADATTAALGGPSPYWQSFSYDKTGNRTAETRHATAVGGQDTLRTYDYPAAGQPRPHTVTSIASTGPGGADTSAYNYDAAGNTTLRPGPAGTQTLSWDPEGRLSKVTDTEGDTSYVYDANGERLIRRDPQSTTLYLDGTEIKLDRATGVTSSTRYYEFLGKTIAVRTGIAGDTVRFLLADHHGTAEVQVNGYTQEITRRRTDPFGRPRGADVPWAGERGFVDGTLDASTGLTHLGAREYDPGIGRFISVDPIIDPGDPQQMHGYAYASNNPTSMTDPDGLRVAEDNEGNSTAAKQSDGSYKYSGKVKQPSSTKGTGSDVQDAERKLNDARKRQEALKRKLINAGKLFLDIILEVTGAKAGIDCFLKGDVGGCIETAVSVISGLVGGLLVKIGLKYALKWKAAAKLAMKVKKLVTDIADVIKNWSKAADEVADARRGLGAAKAAKGTCSFSGDTKVRMAGGKTKPISKIKPGEKVYATDPQTGEKGTRTVTATWAHLDKLVDLKLVGGKRITTTEDHPFWNATDKAWQRADRLDPGDKLTTANGHTLTVTGIAPGSTTVGFAYNLTVDDIHTYYAGESALLVHNSCGGLWTGTKKQSAAENAFRHYKDHGADFADAQNAVQYVEKAQDFLRHPPSGTLTRVRGNGDVVRYHSGTNTFGVMDANGAPRTFFKPDPAVHGHATNMDYFLAQ